MVQHLETFYSVQGPRQVLIKYVWTANYEESDSEVPGNSDWARCSWSLKHHVARLLFFVEDQDACDKGILTLTIMTAKMWCLRCNLYQARRLIRLIWYYDYCIITSYWPKDRYCTVIYSPIWVLLVFGRSFIASGLKDELYLIGKNSIINSGSCGVGYLINAKMELKLITYNFSLLYLFNSVRCFEYLNF